MYCCIYLGPRTPHQDPARIIYGGSLKGEGGTPLDATCNHLLMYCNFLGSTVEEEVLKVHDKS